MQKFPKALINIVNKDSLIKFMLRETLENTITLYSESPSLTSKNKKSLSKWIKKVINDDRDSNYSITFGKGFARINELSIYTYSQMNYHISFKNDLTFTVSEN